MQNTKFISQKNSFPENFWGEKRLVFLNNIEKKDNISGTDSVKKTEQLLAINKWLSSEKKGKKKFEVRSPGTFNELTNQDQFKDLVLEDRKKGMTDQEKLDFMTDLQKRVRAAVVKFSAENVKKLKDEVKKDYISHMERVADYLPTQKDPDVSDPNNWLFPDERTKKVYEKLFGKNGAIRNTRNGKNKNIFGSETNDINEMRDRLTLVKREHDKLAQAREKRIDKNTHLRESMPFQILNGHYKEALKSYQNAPERDKWKYLACAGVIAIGLFKLINSVRKKYPKTTMAAAVLYAANVLTGISSKDKQSLLEKTNLFGSDPDEVTGHTLKKIDELGDKYKGQLGGNYKEGIKLNSEHERAAVALGGVPISELCNAYLEARSERSRFTKKFESIKIRSLKNKDKGAKKWVDPKVTYEFVDSYFRAMGKDYFEAAKESGYLQALILENKQNGGKGIEFELGGKSYFFKEIPIDPDGQINLGIYLFRQRHSTGGRENTFFGASWIESTRGDLKVYCGSLLDKLKYEANLILHYWKNEKNREEITRLVKEGAIEFATFVDKGIEPSWNYIKKGVLDFIDRPYKLAYLSDKVWEITVAGGKKIKILANKTIEKGGEIFEETKDFWKDDYDEITKFWEKMCPVRGKNIAKSYFEQISNGDGDWKLIIPYDADKKIEIFKKSTIVNGVETAKNWTIKTSEKVYEKSLKTTKDVLDWIRRFAGFGKLSNISIENVFQKLENAKGVNSESLQLIKNAVTGMAASEGMRDIFMPLIPLMDEADEDIDLTDVIKEVFKGIFTGNFGPVNENQWLTLVKYKQNEMLLFYQSLLVRKAKEKGNNGTITLSQIGKIATKFKKEYLEPITHDPWFGESEEENIEEKGRWSLINDTDIEDYLDALDRLLSLGCRNKEYSNEVKYLVENMKTIDFEGQDIGEYSHQLKALVLWKFAEIAAPIATFTDKQMSEVDKNYLEYLSTQLLSQLRKLGEEGMRNIVTAPQLKEIFEGKLQVKTLEEFQKNSKEYEVEVKYLRDRTPQNFLDWIKSKKLKIENLSINTMNSVNFEQNSTEYELKFDEKESTFSILGADGTVIKDKIQVKDLAELVKNIQVSEKKPKKKNESRENNSSINEYKSVRKKYLELIEDTGKEDLYSNFNLEGAKKEAVSKKIAEMKKSINELEKILNLNIAGEKFTIALEEFQKLIEKNPRHRGENRWKLFNLTGKTAKEINAETEKIKLVIQKIEEEKPKKNEVKKFEKLHKEYSNLMIIFEKTANLQKTDSSAKTEFEKLNLQKMKSKNAELEKKISEMMDNLANRNVLSPNIGALLNGSIKTAKNFKEAFKGQDEKQIASQIEIKTVELFRDWQIMVRKKGEKRSSFISVVNSNPNNDNAIRQLEALSRIQKGRELIVKEILK